MNNVAVNLVATMMQNNFSQKSYQLPNVSGLNHSNFSSILKSSQSQSKASLSTPRYSSSDVQPKDNAFEKSLDQRQDYLKSKGLSSTERDSLRSNDTTKNEPRDKDISRKGTEVDRNNPKLKEQKNELTKVDDVTKETPTSEEAKVVNEKPSIEDASSTPSSEEISSAEEQLTKDVANALGMTTEELSELLEQFQMTIMDLFNPANFKAIMQEALNVTNAMDLLVSTDALEKLQSVTQLLGDFAETTSAFNENSKLQNLLQQSSEQTNSQEGDQTLFIRMLNNFQDETGAGQSGNGQTGNSATNVSQLVGKSGLAVDASINGTFEGILNQVVTQKTETIVMNGTVATVYKDVTAKDVLDQIVTGMKVNVSEGKSNIVLQLNPENLGKIALSLSHEKGEITGQFVAESEAVKKVIESNLNQLKSQLQNQGINVSEIKIVVGDSTAFFAGEQEKGQSKESYESKRSRRIGNISNISSSFADTILEEDNKVTDPFIHENSSIELHA